jgi:hypothetical protein
MDKLSPAWVANHQMFALTPALSGRRRNERARFDACYNRRVNPDESAVGCTGELIIATRGEAGPGEVLVKIRGGTEAYLAWSEQPLARGTQVLVFNARGGREVDVMEFSTEG